MNARVAANATETNKMNDSGWMRQKKQNLSWQTLHGRDPDVDTRWTIIWDTKRNPEAAGRNTAAERSETSALDRARHILRMGFVVYEVRDPSGALFLAEAAIRRKFGLSAEPQGEVAEPTIDNGRAMGLDREDLVRAMIEAHGDDAAGIAQENARSATIAGQLAAAKSWLDVVDAIQRRQRAL